MKFESDLLMWLQNWYENQCNDEWEHEYGVRIDTIDNPGWSVVIDLHGTYLEKVSMEKTIFENSETDWSNCFISEGQFKGYGGTRNLSRIIKCFKELAESNQPDRIEYGDEKSRQLEQAR